MSSFAKEFHLLGPQLLHGNLVTDDLMFVQKNFISEATEYFLGAYSFFHLWFL